MIYKEFSGRNMECKGNKFMTTKVLIWKWKFLTQKKNIEKKMVKSKSVLFILCETKMFETLFGL